MSNARRTDTEARNYLAAIALIVVVLAITYIAFGSPSVGSQFKFKAMVTSSNQLRSGSPVRIAGVDVGQVTDVKPGPGHTSEITLKVNSAGRPLHRDASLKIRPRLFLEGGFYVDLKAGSPSAPELDSGDTLPLSQTAVPVQLSDILASLDQPSRASFTGVVKELHTGFSGGGATSLRRTAKQLRPVLKDLAWVARAARGTERHDVSRLVAGAARANAALAQDDEAVTELVTNLGTTARALDSGDQALGRSVEALDRLTRTAPDALRGVDGTLPALATFARAVRPGLEGAPAQLRQISAAVGDLATLVSPAERRRLVSALQTTFEDLPSLINRLATLFPVTAPLTACLGSHVVPALNATIPDGTHTTGQPVWQELAHALVGFSGLSQNFDGNGFAVRYGAGLTPAGISLDTIPGLGQIVSNAPTGLQSRPVWLGSGKAPAYRPDAKCSDQPQGDFSSATRTVRADSRKAAARPRITEKGLRKLLAPTRVKKLLGVAP
jgi:virulence factor Mce-like protein